MAIIVHEQDGIRGISHIGLQVNKIVQYHSKAIACSIFSLVLY